MKTNMQQAPIRNSTTICASVYSHSGEFAPIYTDLQLTGRGLDFKFIRSYRSSLAGDIGDMGRGWSSSIAKKIERNGDDIIYHNGAGEVYKFAREKKGNYTSPTGFYGILFQEKEQFFIHQRYGVAYRFEVPEEGGRILGIEDRNYNSIQFSYSANAIVIIDSLNRKIDISISKGLLQELNDHAGRTWKYSYDQNDCLIEVTQPATTDFPNGTSVKYAYDNNHRLISVTDAKSQKYLVNYYDKSGKVVAQEHGSGVFKMEYDAIGEGENGFSTHRTTCITKNESRLVLEHSGVGNVLSRTLFVRKESFAPQDSTGINGNDVPLITNSVYNKNSELTSRIFPAGNKTEWVYSENAEDSLNQGNLLQIIEIPQTEIKSDQTRIVTGYEYEPKFQLTTTHIDPRGNKTSYDYDERGNLIVKTYPSVTTQPVNSGTPRPSPFDRIQQDEYQYNSMGQLLQKKHIDGSITKYHYYPVDDPIGTSGPNTATDNPDKVCGYLARVVRDANGKQIKNEYAYDNFGNAVTVLDGKNNPSRLQYNAMGKVECVTSREPFKHRIDFKYDANYNEIESAQSFERLEYDETKQKTTVKSSILRELIEYNALDNVTLRKIVGDDKIITEYFVRDADEQIINQIQPLGNATEYVYDERNLLIEKKFGVGTKETFSNRFTYTLNGAVRTSTDGNGNTTTHNYDGFHRYKGFTNPIGTKKTQWFDEADNVVRVEIDGLATKKSIFGYRGSAPLMEAKYYFDQWNRMYRVDKAWHNHSNGDKLGESQWNGEKGIVSTVLEYAQNGLPGKVWTETGNVVGVEYDGVGRVVQMKDLTGEEFSFEYDENNNPTLLKHLGPEGEGKRFERALRRSHDEMDRLVWQQENDEAPERFAYNSLGNVINHVGKSGIEIHYTDDSLGRRVGHAYTIKDALDDSKVQKIVRSFEYDDNYRISAYTDAAGKRTMYRYDTLDRQTGVVFPDDNVASVEYDANGNIISEFDQNNNQINNRYNASNQIVERRSIIKHTGNETVEQFEYDGADRLVTAIAPDATIRRTYDSLSRLLTEQQGDHVLGFNQDSSGNLTSLVYPGGEEVHKEYDIQNRVSSVKNNAGETIAKFIYRANDQVAKMLLGSVIETDFSYNQQERLEKIEYRRTDNNKLVEGFQYQYDDTGKMTHEIQLSVGSTYGERYYYDDANRATRAQYGVQNVFDPNSSFEQETSYEHFPEGSWKRRVDLDGQGQIIDDQIGTINQRNNYQDFGKISFSYDANGNCIRKGKSNPGYCEYTYDQDNKLIKSLCYDAQGNQKQTIEYFYDSFGRQVRKIVTDMSGSITDYTYVWGGSILLQEYENGVLVRTYCYGIGSTPVQLSDSKGGRHYYYTHNGKGLASGLLHQKDPYKFVETYFHEFAGGSFMKEINGIPIGIPSRNSTISSMLNSILSGDYLRDWMNGSDSFIGGTHLNPEIAAMLNGGMGNGGVRGAMIKQFNDFLKSIGCGNYGNGLTGGGKQGGLPPGVKLGYGAPNWSLYGGGGPFDVSSPTPPYKMTSEAEKLGNKVMNNPVVKVIIEGVNAGVIPVVTPAGSNPAKDAPPPGSSSSAGDVRNLGEKAAEEAKAKAQKDAEDKAKRDADDAAKKKAADEEENKRKLKEAEEEEPEEDEGSAMTDPDYVHHSSGSGMSLREMARYIYNKLNETRRPAEPNGGIGSPGINTSYSPPPKKGGIDPTIAYFVDDPGFRFFGGIFTGNKFISNPQDPYAHYVKPDYGEIRIRKDPRGLIETGQPWP